METYTNGKKEKGKIRERIGLFNVRVGGVDLTFLVLVLLLLTIGLVMLFSASYAHAYYYYGQSFIYISSQLTYAIAGVILMLLISTVDYRVLFKMAWPLYGVTMLLLVAVLFFPARNNAHRWIDLKVFTFQPSEIAKFAIVVLFAHMIAILHERMHTFRSGLLPFGLCLLPVVALMIMEPHLSGTLLILGIAAIMLIVGGANMKWFAAAAILGGLGIAVIAITGVVGYAPERIMTWLDPWSYPKDEGFQTIQSLYAIGSGGLMGVGIGSSRQKYLYLPEPQNDFIFAIVCEELGFVGATLIIILFALLVWRGFVIAMRCRDRFGSMIAVGLTAQVGLQTILNIMVVTNTVPNTGISLPFFSYGGTALIMLLCQMGVVLAISRHTTMEKQ